LKGKDSQNGLAKKYGISNKLQVLKWVYAYQASGDVGLKQSREKGTYFFEYKLSVAESYLFGEFSYSELADCGNIDNPCIITSWVKAYRDNGSGGLCPKKQGR
jgi:transposase-like protein